MIKLFYCILAGLVLSDVLNDESALLQSTRSSEPDADIQARKFMKGLQPDEEEEEEQEWWEGAEEDDSEEDSEEDDKARQLRKEPDWESMSPEEKQAVQETMQQGEEEEEGKARKLRKEPDWENMSPEEAAAVKEQMEQEEEEEDEGKTRKLRKEPDWENMSPEEAAAVKEQMEQEEEEEDEGKTRKFLKQPKKTNVWGGGWAERINDNNGLSHSVQSHFQRKLVMIHNLVRSHVSNVHRRLANAEIFIAESRRNLNQGLKKTSSVVKKAQLIDDYMGETLPMWEMLMENATSGWGHIYGPMKGRFSKQPVITNYLTQTDKTLSRVDNFVKSMIKLRSQWHEIGAGELVKEKDAMDRLDSVQTKTEEGLVVFQRAETDWSQDLDDLSVGVDKLTKKLGAETETVTLVTEISNTLRTESKAIGKKMLKLFGEMVGASDTAFRDVAEKMM